jgi:hypothetical protein
MASGGGEDGPVGHSGTRRTAGVGRRGRQVHIILLGQHQFRSKQYSNKRSKNVPTSNRNETKTSEFVPESAPWKEIISI